MYLTMEYKVSLKYKHWLLKCSWLQEASVDVLLFTELPVALSSQRCCLIVSSWDAWHSWVCRKRETDKFVDPSLSAR